MVVVGGQLRGSWQSDESIFQATWVDQTSVGLGEVAENCICSLIWKR